MQSPMSLVFFIVFALILVGMYVGIRRRLAGPGIVAAVGVLGSIISIMLMSLAQGNNVLQAVVVGILIGAIFSVIVLVMAWYFQTNESEGVVRPVNADPAQTTSSIQDDEY